MGVMSRVLSQSAGWKCGIICIIYSARNTPVW